MPSLKTSNGFQTIQFFQGCPSGPNLAPKNASFNNLPSTISSLCFSISSTSQFALKNPPRKKSACGLWRYKVKPAVRACLSLAKGVKLSTTIPRLLSASTIPGWMENTRMLGCSVMGSVNIGTRWKLRTAHTEIDVLAQFDGSEFSWAIRGQAWHEK